MKIRIALGQIKSHYCELEENIANHIAWINRAKQRGAHLIVFPELSLTGYTLRDALFDRAVRLDHPLVEELASAADSIGVVAGLAEHSDDNRFFNTAVYLENRQIAGVHRKVFLPDYGMFEEGRYFAAGNELAAYDAPWGTFGIVICEDAWHPWLVMELAEQNIVLLVIITAQ